MTYDWGDSADATAQRVREAGGSVATEPDGAKRFYGAVFGWETDAFGEMTMWRVPGYVGGEPEQPVARDVVAGMAPLPAGDGRPRWRADFWVDDVDATVAKATALGGDTVVPVFEAEFLRQTVIADPEGASFSVMQITTPG